MGFGVGLLISRMWWAGRGAEAGTFRVVSVTGGGSNELCSWFGSWGDPDLGGHRSADRTEDQDHVQRDGCEAVKKEIAIRLRAKALEVAKTFSNPERAHNPTAEVFELEGIEPTSEDTAAVYFKKNTGKRALAFFYWVNAGSGEWRYFFPTDSHILGMLEFKDRKVAVEAVNFPLNQ